MLLTFEGRNSASKNSHPTCKDALVHLNRMPPRKVVRVTAKSMLVLHERDEIVSSPRKLKICQKMAQDISMQEAKMNERLSIAGTAYFNLQTGEVIQLLEGWPQDLSETLKHTVRDVRQTSLHFQIERGQIQRKFSAWGCVWAATKEEWKIIQLTWPSPADWERLQEEKEEDGVNSDAKASAAAGTEAKASPLKPKRRRSSLMALVESKRYAVEALGPDCRRFWRRREAVCTWTMSSIDRQYFRKRREVARRRQLKGESKRKPKSRATASLFSCITDQDEEGRGGSPDAPEPRPKHPAFDELDAMANSPLDMSAGSSPADSPRSSKLASTSMSRSRISQSHSSVMEVLREEEAGFTESMHDIQAFFEMQMDRSSSDNVGGRVRFKKGHTSESSISRSHASRSRKRRTDSKSGPAPTWKLVQSIGPDEEAAQSAQGAPDDFVTSLQLDHSGDFLAIGDNQGRIGVFSAEHARRKNGQGASQADPYLFFEEFVSHQSQFDTLYSRKIPCSIVAMEWLRRYSKSMHILSANEKEIKLWKLREFQQEGGEFGVFPTNSRVFKKGHPRFFIHSLSATSDGETFFSADELLVNLWSLERPDAHMTIINELPDSTDTTDMLEMQSIITNVKACPVQCWKFIYSTSVGDAHVGDLRMRSRMSRPGLTLHYEAKDQGLAEHVLREACCITDTAFARSGDTIITRQFASMNFWDIRKATRPYMSLSQLPKNTTIEEFFGKGCLLDDFRIACDETASTVISGGYSNFFRCYDIKRGKNHWLQARHEQDMLDEKTPRDNADEKVLHVDMNHNGEVAVAASALSVYVYKKDKKASGHHHHHHHHKKSKKDTST